MRFNGDVLGSVAGMLEVTGDGDSVNVTPVVTSGTKIATIIINEGSPEEESVDLYAPEGFSGDYNDLTNKPDLFSGVYSDLTSKPYLNGNVISGNMFTNIYSNDEQVVGMWFGKPLYRTIYTGLNVTPAYNYWTDIVATPTNMEIYIGSDIMICYNANGNIDLNHTGLEIAFSKSDRMIRASYNQNANLRPINILSVLYTKTTD